LLYPATGSSLQDGRGGGVHLLQDFLQRSPQFSLPQAALVLSQSPFLTISEQKLSP